MKDDRRRGVRLNLYQIERIKEGLAEGKTTNEINEELLLEGLISKPIHRQTISAIRTGKTHNESKKELGRLTLEQVVLIKRYLSNGWSPSRINKELLNVGAIIEIIPFYVIDRIRKGFVHQDIDPDLDLNLDLNKKED